MLPKFINGLQKAKMGYENGSTESFEITLSESKAYKKVLTFAEYVS